jgi:hypothetical protein
MFTLVIYTNGSVLKYQNVYEDHVYEIKDQVVLYVYKIDKSSGDENEIAVFNNWDYLLIEGD